MNTKYPSEADCSSIHKQWERVEAVSRSIFLDHHFDILSNGYDVTMYSVLGSSPLQLTELAPIANSTARHLPALTANRPRSIDKVILDIKAMCGQMRQMFKTYAGNFDDFVRQNAHCPSRK